MPLTEEAEFWTNAVYQAIQAVPPGTVTSYGHVAALLGERMFPILSLITPYPSSPVPMLH